MNEIILKSDTGNEVVWGFRKFLTDKRNEQGLSVRQLGAKAGVSYTVIYDLEQRNVLPKMDTLVKIANALGYIADIKLKQNVLILSFGDEQSIRNRKTITGCITTPVSIDEQLSKILAQKGLYTKEIEEITDFVNFKLSQHKK